MIKNSTISGILNFLCTVLNKNWPVATQKAKKQTTNTELSSKSYNEYIQWPAGYGKPKEECISFPHYDFEVFSISIHLHKVANRNRLSSSQLEEMALFVYGRRGKHKYFSLYEKSSTYIYHSRTNPRLVQGIQVILSPDVYHIFSIPRHPDNLPILLV